MSTATVDDIQTPFGELAAKLAPEAHVCSSRLLGAAQGLAQFGEDFDEPVDLKWGALK